MATGLPPSDVVNVDILLEPQAAQERNFGNLIIIGDSDVIDTVERLRPYTSPDQGAQDFGVDAPEYKAMVAYFGQSPSPEMCYVGRWASTGTKGLLRGAILSPANQGMANFTTVNNGALSMLIDGVPRVLTGMDLSAQTNLNGVASVVQIAFGGSASVTWDANNKRFLVESASIGSLSTVAFATPPGSGTDLGARLGLTNTSGGYSVAGIVAESLTFLVAYLADKTPDWYGLMVAANASPDDDSILAVAAFIEAAKPSRIFGVTTQDPATLDPSTTTDIASLLNDGGFKRTCIQYSSTNEFAIASLFGRAFTVDFSGTDTTITLDFKQEPGVTSEIITESQRQALAGKKCNAFLKFNNGTSILQQGWMCSGNWFDEIHGTDWLQNEIQTNIWNLFLTIGTKVAQTDAGLNKLLMGVTDGMEQGVTNGLLFRGGVWSGPDIGAVLKTGDTLTKGYLVFAPKVSTQTKAARAARKTPLIQAPCKLAGAFHSTDVLVSVNQ